MDIRSKIMAKQAEGRNAMMGNFTNADEVISKGISQKQFNERYEAGHEVFTAEAINKFKEDCLEKGEESGAILEEIAKLKRVEVIKGNSTEIFFVKEEDIFAEEADEEEEDLI